MAKQLLERIYQQVYEQYWQDLPHAAKLYGD